MITAWNVGIETGFDWSGHNAGLLLDTMIPMEDTLMPAQWAQRHQGQTSCEKALWLAVLTEAVALATKPLKTINTRKHCEEACEWIAADATAIGSFRWVCDVLALDADWVRRVIGERDGHVKMRRVFAFLHKATNSTNAAREVA